MTAKKVTKPASTDIVEGLSIAERRLSLFLLTTPSSPAG